MHALQPRLVEIVLAIGAAALAVYVHAYLVWL